MRRVFRRLLLLLTLLLLACNRVGQTPTPTVASAAEGATPTAPPTVPPATPTVTAGPTASPTFAPGMFRNPVLDKDFPDPDALKIGDTYYAYATNSDGRNIQVARSDDLVEWKVLGDALPQLPSWAAQGFGWAWAPEGTTTAEGQQYLLYFTARYTIGEVGGRQCIGVATSGTAEGPFHARSEAPFVCQLDEGGSIDPSSFVDDDGTRYVLWKNDGNCCASQTWIYIQRVSDDGLTLQGEPARLITADQRWEGILVEAPTLWKHDGKYYLFYSANDYASPKYAIGYAAADAVLGPYQKPAGPLLKTTLAAGIVGPGGQDIVTDEDGEPWMLYHAWAPGGYRHMRLDRLVWRDGVPVVEGPSREPQPAPP